MSDDLAARLEEAWEEAGDRLGIDVEVSYLLDTAMGSVQYPVYGRYDAEEFRATLQDWGWTGPPDTAPGWLV